MSGNAYYDIAYPADTLLPIQAWNSTQNITVGGALIMNPSSSCSLDASSIAAGGNQFNSSCDYGPGLVLTPTVISAPANTLFVGPVASDGTNGNGGSLPLGFAGITDWINFANPYRGWGVNSGSYPNAGEQAQCASGDSCTIYDARLLGTSSVLRGYFGTFTPAAACPASVNASVAGNVITDGNGNIFLKNAVEIVGDLVKNPNGNQDGLCESGETCIFMPNFGSYQGEGSLVGPCTFTGGNGVTGVTIYGYAVNGALAFNQPTQTVAITGPFTFTVAGGLGPYTYTVVSGNGMINSSTGVFTAPANTETDTIKVTDSLGNTATATVTVSAPVLAWSPLTLNFGSIAYAYGKSASTTFYLSNTGVVSATGCSAPTLTGTNAGDFEISIDDCGTSNVAAAGNCHVNVRAKPTAAGLRTATLSRTCTVGGVTTTTANQLQATGIAASANLVINDQSNGQFEISTLNKHTAIKNVTIGNTGTATATGCGAPSIVDTTNFAIVSQNCGATLAVGASCTVQVQADVASAGSYSTPLSMTCTGTSANLTLSVAANYSNLPTQVSVGFPTVFLMNDGRVRYTDINTYYPDESGDFTDATMVAAGDKYYCGLHSGGTIQCWGDNTYGNLGDGTTTNAYGAATTVSGITNAISVAANGYASHTCAALSTGQVKCWGLNASGELGNGTTTNSSTPVLVSGISTATAVAVGAHNSCAVLSNGELQCWGGGQLGDGNGSASPTPVNVQTSSGVNLTNVSQVASSSSNGCALTTGGTVYCWGWNGVGQVGDGTSGNYRYYATQVSGITNAAQIAMAYENSLRPSN